MQSSFFLSVSFCSFFRYIFNPYTYISAGPYVDNPAKIMENILFYVLHLFCNVIMCCIYSATSLKLKMRSQTNLNCNFHTSIIFGLMFRCRINCKVMNKLQQMTYLRKKKSVSDIFSINRVELFWKKKAILSGKEIIKFVKTLFPIKLQSLERKRKRVKDLKFYWKCQFYWALYYKSKQIKNKYVALNSSSDFSAERCKFTVSSHRTPILHLPAFMV